MWNERGELGVLVGCAQCDQYDLSVQGRDERTVLNLGPGPLASPLAATSGRQVSGSSSGTSSAGSCSTMYTNAANLQHTIEVSMSARPTGVCRRFSHLLRW